MAQSASPSSQPVFFPMWDKYVNPTSLLLSGLADADENCKRFIDRCMPEAFKKVSNDETGDLSDCVILESFADMFLTFLFSVCHQLLTSSAVHKWGTEIHEGIYNMLMLLVELVAERVKQDPVPVNLMGVLTMVCSLSVSLNICLLIPFYCLFVLFQSFFKTLK